MHFRIMFTCMAPICACYIEKYLIIKMEMLVSNILKGLLRNLAFTLIDCKLLEGFEQRNDVIWNIFKRITLATVLRIDCRGQGWKWKNKYETIEIFQASDDGGLNYGSNGGGGWTMIGFRLCFQDKGDSICRQIRCISERVELKMTKFLAWAIRRMELLYNELSKTVERSFSRENSKSLVLKVWKSLKKCDSSWDACWIARWRCKIRDRG